MGELDMLEKVNDHEQRILKLEDNQKEINESIKQLKTHHEETKIGLSEIRSTVLAESNVQKDLLGSLINHHFAQKAQELAANTEVKKLHWQTAAALLGSGGLIFGIFQWVMTKF